MCLLLHESMTIQWTHMYETCVPVLAIPGIVTRKCTIRVV